MELHHSSEKEAPKKVTKLFFNIPLAATAIDRTALVRDHTFSNGTLMAVLRSSHSGTGRFLERMKAGLNSFD
jgi:hypothetical protein